MKFQGKTCAALGGLFGIAIWGAMQAHARAFLPQGIDAKFVSEAPHIANLGAETVGCLPVVTTRHADDKSEKVITAHMAIYNFAKANGLKMGPGALEISESYETANGQWVLHACRALETLPSEVQAAGSGINFKTIPAGRVVQAMHRGDHDTIKRTADAIEAHIVANNLTRIGPLIEYHFNHKPPSEWHDQISVVSIYVK